jgi:hypothetical protein
MRVNCGQEIKVDLIAKELGRHDIWVQFSNVEGQVFRRDWIHTQHITELTSAIDVGPMALPAGIVLSPSVVGIEVCSMFDMFFPQYLTTLTHAFL